MLKVILFTKAGCSLCDELKMSLETFQNTYPHQLQEVDITQDNSLHKQYRYSIPVVRIGEQELTAPITAVQLQNALQKAS